MQKTLANPVTQMSDNLDKSLKNETFFSQLSTYFKRYVTFRKADLSVQTKLDSFFKPLLLCLKTSSTSDPSVE
jgi:hypothetical protein